ncbi:hypothetical protein [Terrabacter sp. Ter38]|nr:hypothetical protein [Terrabacter sp. Ter38]
MIALALTAPLLGFGLLLVLEWFEERVMASETGTLHVRTRG